MQEEIDILILGSGLGGLVCGAILSAEGYKVCILEKNKQIGGCLQTFVRDKTIFDSGVHYIGGLAKGQNLYQIFSFLGLMDKLKLQRLDPEAFDKVIFLGDANEYPMAQGHENFIQQLLPYFPDEEKAIRTYIEKMREICARFPMYNLRMSEGYNEKAAFLETDAKAYIETLTDNQRLRDVLAGNNFLYAGIPDKTPFYVHALIINSFIESAWKCIDGGSQISKQLGKIIRKNGSDIKRHCKVTNVVEEEGVIAYVELEDGEKVYAKHFISNIHPAQTFQMLKSNKIRSAYKNKIQTVKNSIASLTVNIVLKPGSFKYFKHNYYYHGSEDSVWYALDYNAENWPINYCLFLSASSKSPEYADAMTLLAYMRYDEMQEWEHTYNTVSQVEDRGESYEAFKKRKAEKLIDEVEEKFPGLRDCIQSYYVSTPLSFRDYIGSADGSMYGIAKDYKDPLMSFISPRTKIPNLFFTGQNLSLHGILGVTINALSTCSYFTDIEKLLEKIRHAD